ncbi:alpha/beta fold hydrolase [Streptomyces sp. NPDC096136]|uniref:alpha/beta fold hydrolase n=1 Tax=Streptomyces sp. NPDC096136 TaxID=3366076 RepID=UPI0038129FA0
MPDGNGRLGVVLVHGFASGPDTWDALRERIAEDASLSFVDTLAFSYDTGVVRINPLKVRPSLSMAADSLKEYLRTDTGTSSRPLVLVAHSMGGLIVQRYLQRMLADGLGRELARIRRVVLLACPNDGSELMLSLRRSLFGAKSAQEGELRPLDDQVAETRRVILRDVVYATAATERTCPIPFDVYAGESDGIVRFSSARSAFPDTAVLPGDHFGILKARTPEHRTFTTLRRLIREARTAPRGPAAGAGDPEADPEPDAYAPLRALAGLPRIPEAFVGREEEVRTMWAALAPPPAPPAAEEEGRAGVQLVVGMGGVGKTALVLQVAARALAEPDWCSGGVLYADLNGYDPVAAQQATPTDVLDTFLRALGVVSEAIPVGVTARSAHLRTLLRQRNARGLRTLLVLDNAGGESQVRPLLPDDAATPVLVTSRSTLDIDARMRELGSLPPAASVELIRAALHQAFGDEDTRVEDEPDAARRVAELCGGLPLALHIVSALLVDTARRPLSALAEGLLDARTRLARLSRADQAVTAAFDLSYRTLAADRARLFRLLSLNPGPELSTAAAGSLLDIADTHDVEDALQDLVRTHLVEASPVWGRWRMHDLLRLHAAAHGAACAAEDEREAARERLLGHYLHTTRAAVARLPQQLVAPAEGFPDRGRAMGWLKTERPNLVAASLSAPEGSAAYGYLALALGAFFDRGRHYDDWIATGTQAAAAFRTLGAALQEAQALNFTGHALRQAGHVERAAADHERALALFREVGDRHGQAQALNNLGLCHQQSRQVALALREHSKADRLYEEAGDIRGRAQALNNLGLAQCRILDHDQALRTYTQARQLFAEAGDRYGEAQVLNNVGSCHRDMRLPAEAVVEHRAAAALYDELGDVHSAAGALLNAGLALFAYGHWREAAAALELARERYDSAGDAAGAANALNASARVFLSQNRGREAGEALASALTVFVELGDRAGEAAALSLRGRVQALIGDGQGMLDSYRQAADLYHLLGDRVGEASARAEISLDRMRWATDYSGYEGA